MSKLIVTFVVAALVATAVTTGLWLVIHHLGGGMTSDVVVTIWTLAALLGLTPAFAEDCAPEPRDGRA